MHQVRVEARRLRAAIRLFAPYISSLQPKAMEERLKWLGQQAGAVRDLDVLEKLLRKRSKKLDAAVVQDLGPLFEELRVRRAKAADDLARALSSSRIKSLLARLSAPIAITTRGDEAFGAVAGELFAPILKSLFRAAEKMHEDPTPADLHRLRKRAKASRYALETMIAIDEKQLVPMLDGLEELQDLVGAYHDAVVAVRWIMEFVGARALPANLAFACGALAEALHRSEGKLKQRGLKRWRRFVKSDPAHTIRKALAKVQPKKVPSDEAVHHASRARERAHSQG